MRVPVCLVGIGELVSRTSRQASVGDGWCCGLRLVLECGRTPSPSSLVAPNTQATSTASA